VQRDRLKHLIDRCVDAALAHGVLQYLGLAMDRPFTERPSPRGSLGKLMGPGAARGCYAVERPRQGTDPARY
jgi:hypothetical protein